MKQITHLVPAVQFGQTLKEYSDADYRRIRDNYDAMLLRSNRLGFLIPCTLDDVPLTLKDEYSIDEKEQYAIDVEAYQEAKSRCLFEGDFQNDHGRILIGKNLIPVNLGKTIEEFVNHGWKLTPTAIQEIYGR